MKPVDNASPGAAPFFAGGWKSPFTPRACLFALWGLALATVVWRLAHGHGLHYYLLGMDFRAMYTGARMALGGVRERFYDIDTQFIWQQRVFPELLDQTQLMPFPYPPFVAGMLAPLGLVDPPWAFLLWSGINLGVLAACLILADRCLDIAGGTTQRRAFLLTLVFLPTMMFLLQGQLTGVKLLALWLSWHLLQKRQAVLTGVSLSMLAVKPQFLLFPFLYLVSTRQWRIVVGLVLSGTALAAVCYAMVGLDGLQGYIELLWDASNWGDAYTIHPQWMYSYRGLLHSLARSDDLAGIMAPWLAGLATIAATVVWAWRRSAGSQGETLALQWSIMIVAMVLTSPQLNMHSLLLLAPAGVLAARAAMSWPPADISARLLVTPFAYGAPVVTIIWFSVPQSAVAVIVALEMICLGVLVWVAARRRALHNSVSAVVTYTEG